MKIEKPNSICNEDTFNDMFRMYAEDLYKFLYYKYGEANNPADIVQEAFIKLWDNCDKVFPGKVRGFLYTVANNLTLSSIARKKTAKKYIDETDKWTSYHSPEYELEEKEYKQQLDQAIAGLTEEQRVAFLLNRVEGKKHQEIAEILGISKKGVEKRIYITFKRI